RAREAAIWLLGRMAWAPPPRSFFFQAEDGIRDFHVTGVQTCALPIFEVSGADLSADFHGRPLADAVLAPTRIYVKPLLALMQARSEERRVGKECRARWSPDD